MLNEGPRLLYGMGTVLVASRVKDLCIQEDSSGKCVMEWTMPAGIGIDSKTLRTINLNNPFRRRLVFKRWHAETESLLTKTK